MNGSRIVDRRSWLWLIVGALLLCFSSPQPALPIAAWLAPAFLLRFTRTQRPRVGLSVLALVMVVVLSVKWAIGFAPVTFLGISGGIAALLTMFSYAADRWLTPRVSGVPRTLVFPLALTSVDWLGSTLAAPLAPYVLPSFFGVAATWNSPAYTQADNLPLIQIVSITGLWGLTFLIGWFASVANALWEHSFDWRPVRMSVLALAGVLVAVHSRRRAGLAWIPAAAIASVR